MLRLQNLAEHWRLNFNTMLVVARCFDGHGGVGRTDYAQPPGFPCLWNSSTGSASRHYKPLWDNVKCDPGNPQVFKTLDWWAGAFLHGFCPGKIERGLQQLTEPVRFQPPRQRDRTPPPSVVQLKQLDCEPLPSTVPKGKDVQPGWDRLPSEPPQIGSTSDLQVTTDLKAPMMKELRQLSACCNG